MSISDQVTRLTTARNTIRNWLVSVGLGTSADKMDTMATAIENIINQGAISANVKEGETYTIPKGYHNGSGTVSGVAGGGNYTLQSKTVTPTKKQQAIAPDSGYYGLDSVVVNAIPDVYQDVSSVTADAPDVLANKIIVKQDGTVTAGTMPNNGSVTSKLSIRKPTYIIPAGYHDGTGRVSVDGQQKTVTPTESEQTITADGDKFLTSVLVDAIPMQYADVSEATAESYHILSGEIAWSSEDDATSPTSKSPIRVVGTMPNNGGKSITFDGLTTMNYTIPMGYHNGRGTVSLTGDIEEALAAI